MRQKFRVARNIKDLAYDMILRPSCWEEEKIVLGYLYAGFKYKEAKSETTKYRREPALCWTDIIETIVIRSGYHGARENIDELFNVLGFDFSDNTHLDNLYYLFKSFESVF